MGRVGALRGGGEGAERGPLPLGARRAVPPAPPPTPRAAGEGGGGGWAPRWQLGGLGGLGVRGLGDGRRGAGAAGALAQGAAAGPAYEGPQVRFCTVMVGPSDATKWRLALPSRG